MIRFIKNLFSSPEDWTQVENEFVTELAQIAIKRGLAEKTDLVEALKRAV